MDLDRNNDRSPQPLPFSEAAVRLLEEARGESARLRHGFIGTEHIVLALTNPESAAPTVLTRLGIDRAHVRNTLNAMITPGAVELPPESEQPYTSRTTKAFSFAEACASAFGHPQIGPEHLLVGVMRERLSPGAQVLYHHGLTSDRVWEAIERDDVDDR